MLLCLSWQKHLPTAKFLTSSPILLIIPEHSPPGTNGKGAETDITLE